MSDDTRYEIFITDDDVPQKVGSEIGKRGYARTLNDDATKVFFMCPTRFLKAIDEGGSSIGVARPAILRAIVRQAMESKPEIVTGWGRQPLYDPEAEG